MVWETHSEMIKRENEELRHRVSELERKVASIEGSIQPNLESKDMTWLHEWCKSMITTAPVDIITRITLT